MYLAQECNIATENRRHCIDYGLYKLQTGFKDLVDANFGFLGGNLFQIVPVPSHGLPFTFPDYQDSL